MDAFPRGAGNEAKPSTNRPSGRSLPGGRGKETVDGPPAPGFSPGDLRRPGAGAGHGPARRLRAVHGAHGRFHRGLARKLRPRHRAPEPDLGFDPTLLRRAIGQVRGRAGSARGRDDVHRRPRRHGPRRERHSPAYGHRRADRHGHERGRLRRRAGARGPRRVAGAAQYRAGHCLRGRLVRPVRHCAGQPGVDRRRRLVPGLADLRRRRLSHRSPGLGPRGQAVGRRRDVLGAVDSRGVGRSRTPPGLLAAQRRVLRLRLSRRLRCDPSARLSHG